MSARSMREVAEAIAALAPPTDSHEALAEWMRARAALIAELSRCPIPATEDRAEVRAALEAALARDAELIDEARAAMSKVDVTRERVRGGRTAVIGYRNAAPHGSGAVIRSA